MTSGQLARYARADVNAGEGEGNVNVARRQQHGANFYNKLSSAAHLQLTGFRGFLSLKTLRRANHFLNMRCLKTTPSCILDTKRVISDLDLDLDQLQIFLGPLTLPLRIFSIQKRKNKLIKKYLERDDCRIKQYTASATLQTPFQYQPKYQIQRRYRSVSIQIQVNFSGQTNFAVHY